MTVGDLVQILQYYDEKKIVLIPAVDERAVQITTILESPNGKYIVLTGSFYGNTMDDLLDRHSG